MKTGSLKYLIILYLFFIGSSLYGQSQHGHAKVTDTTS